MWKTHYFGKWFEIKFYKFPGKDLQLKGNIFWQEHNLNEDRKVSSGGIKIHKLNSVVWCLKKVFVGYIMEDLFNEHSF